MTAYEIVTLIINNTRCQFDANVKVDNVYTKDELIAKVQVVLIDERDHYKALMEYWKSRCEAAEKVIEAFAKTEPFTYFSTCIKEHSEHEAIKAKEPK